MLLYCIVEWEWDYQSFRMRTKLLEWKWDYCILEWDCDFFLSTGMDSRYFESFSAPPEVCVLDLDADTLTM